MSKYTSKFTSHQTLKIPNLEQYVAIFPKGAGTGPVPKRVRKIPAILDPISSFIPRSLVNMKGSQSPEFNQICFNLYNDIIAKTILQTACTHLIHIHNTIKCQGKKKKITF